MRTALLILLPLLANSVNAQDVEPCEEKVNPIVAAVQKQGPETCPNWNKIKDLCAYIGGHTKDPQPLKKELQYMYQRKVYESSCVDLAKDNQEAINKKIQAMWSSFEGQLVCNNFDVINGSALKYAAQTNFDPFIFDAIKWKINLNKVDKTDNRTLLDYVDFQRKKNKGNALEPILNDYYEELQNAGAKHLKDI